MVTAKSRRTLCPPFVKNNKGYSYIPEICRFYGIIIAMFFDDYNPPHFHARYGKEKVAIEISSLRILEGTISPRALGLVIEWASQHKDELLHVWELARNRQPLHKIEPLK